MTELSNVILLSISWAWTFSAATVLTFVAPKVAKSIMLKDSDFYGTLTLAVFIVGTAVANIPSAKIFNEYGRVIGFLIGSFCLIVGSIMVTISVAHQVYALLVIGCFLMGTGLGFGQFYRFAAIDVASEKTKNRAVTYVLAGGCIAAFAGPTLGWASKTMIGPYDYIGSCVIMVVMSIFSVGGVIFVRFPSLPDTKNEDDLHTEHDEHSIEHESEHEHEHGHELDEIDSPSKGLVSKVDGRTPEKKKLDIWQSISSGFFIDALLLATVAMIFMIVLMVTSIVEMDDSSYSIVEQSLVLDVHFFCMFFTGIITGYLLDRLGLVKVISLGWIVQGLSLLFFVFGRKNIAFFFLGDALLGISWNMLFSTSTVMLSLCYNKHDRFEVQAIFEFIINTTSGCLTLLAGYVFNAYGWRPLVFSYMVLYGLISLGGLAWTVYRRDSRKGKDGLYKGGDDYM